MFLRKRKIFIPVSDCCYIPEIQPKQIVDAHGVTRVVFVEVTSEDRLKEQLPVDLTISDIVSSGEMIKPKTLNIMMPSDKYDLQRLAQDGVFNYIEQNYKIRETDTVSSSSTVSPAPNSENPIDNNKTD